MNGHQSKRIGRDGRINSVYLSNLRRRKQGVYSASYDDKSFVFDCPPLDCFTDLELEYLTLNGLAVITLISIRDGGQTDRIELKVDPLRPGQGLRGAKTWMAVHYMAMHCDKLQTTVANLKPTARARNKLAPKSRKTDPRFVSLQSKSFGRKVFDYANTSAHKVTYIHDYLEDTLTRIPND